MGICVDVHLPVLLYSLRSVGYQRILISASERIEDWASGKPNHGWVAKAPAEHATGLHQTSWSGVEWWNWEARHGMTGRCKNSSWDSASVACISSLRVVAVGMWNAVNKASKQEEQRMTQVMLSCCCCRVAVLQQLIDPLFIFHGWIILFVGKLYQGQKASVVLAGLFSNAVVWEHSLVAPKNTAMVQPCPLCTHLTLPALLAPLLAQEYCWLGGTFLHCWLRPNLASWKWATQELWSRNTE